MPQSGIFVERENTQADEVPVTPNRAGFINLMNSDLYVPCEPLRPTIDEVKCRMNSQSGSTND
jgi:hypothetical protein